MVCSCRDCQEGVDGIEKLLQIVSTYRKRDPEDVHEEEFVENAFNCICAALVGRADNAVCWPCLMHGLVNFFVVVCR